jgi:hypothetical protein
MHNKQRLGWDKLAIRGPLCTGLRQPLQQCECSCWVRLRQLFRVCKLLWLSMVTHG